MFVQAYCKAHYTVNVWVLSCSHAKDREDVRSPTSLSILFFFKGLSLDLKLIMSARVPGQ